MRNYNASEKNIILSFIIVSILLILLGVISVVKMIELSEITKKMYEHPLKVSNATQDIQTHLVSMHRYMKDVVLAKNEKELQIALANVNRNEKVIHKNFDIVFSRYLGDKADIHTSYNLFISWKEIRDEVVELTHDNKSAKAIEITKNKGAEHVYKLNKSVDILVDYANKKASQFVEHASKTKNLSISITLGVVMIILFMIFSIVVVLLKSLENASQLREEQTQQFLSQSRLAQMGEMISMIAHQWRQPLGAIASTAIDMKMKIELEEFDLEKRDSRVECVNYLNDRLDNIDSFVHGLTNTIDDFRDFYKPNKKKEYTYITEPIHKTLNIIENSLKSNNIKLIQNYYSNKKIYFNSSEIMQVLLNIFKNSEDNIKLKNIKSASIWITTTDTKYGISIKVCDNSGGIDENIINKIFDPYFSTKHEKNGTGLGLYMSKVIVQEHHDGKLLVKNTSDGVCFVIKINNSENKNEN